MHSANVHLERTENAVACRKSPWSRDFRPWRRASRFLADSSRRQWYGSLMLSGPWIGRLPQAAAFSVPGGVCLVPAAPSDAAVRAGRVPGAADGHAAAALVRPGLAGNSHSEPRLF